MTDSSLPDGLEFNPGEENREGRMLRLRIGKYEFYIGGCKHDR